MPTITVAGVLMSGDHILLCQRQESAPFYPGLWYAPAGYLEDDDESTEHALLRVVEETLGVFTTEFEFLNTLYDQTPGTDERYIHNLYVVYGWEGELDNLAPAEQVALRWFNFSDLDKLPMADPVRKLLVALYEGADEEVDSIGGWL